MNEEGIPSSSWMLLDYGDFIFHIFAPQEERDRYDLEGLWNQAKRLKVPQEIPELVAAVAVYNH